MWHLTQVLGATRSFQGTCARRGSDSFKELLNVVKAAEIRNLSCRLDLPI